MVQSNIIHHRIITLWSDDGHPISGDLRYPEAAQMVPIVVICHSFMAFKDWGFFPHMGEKLAQSGFATFVFNFSFNGVHNSDDRITDFGQFERNTFSRELKDCEVVLSAIERGELRNGVVDTEKVIFLGHSRGAAIAIVAASRHEKIKALVSLSTIGMFDRWTEHQKDNWRKKGFLPLARDTAASPLRLGIGLLEDLEWNGEEINIEKAVTRITVPWLMVHGKIDVTVPYQEAERLFAAADKTVTEFVLLEKVGHLYRAATKKEDNYATLDHILEYVSVWLHKYF